MVAQRSARAVAVAMMMSVHSRLAPLGCWCVRFWPTQNPSASTHTLHIAIQYIMCECVFSQAKAKHCAEFSDIWRHQWFGAALERCVLVLMENEIVCICKETFGIVRVFERCRQYIPSQYSIGFRVKIPVLIYFGVEGNSRSQTLIWSMEIGVNRTD